MRYAALSIAGVALLLTGATCFPLMNLNQTEDGATAGTVLGISLMQPEADREVPLGTVIQIEWAAVNLTDADALATILVRNRDNGEETILAGGLRLPAAGTSDTVAWDTSEFQGGSYSIVGRVEAGERSDEDTAPGRITINTPPSFDFTEPTEDTELVEPDPNDPNAPEEATITIRWTAFDPDGDGTAQIGIDPDLDHESGNEITIAERSIAASSGFETLEWTGTGTDGQRVAADTYYLYALVSDGINEDRFVEGLAQLIVPEEPNAAELAITEPEDDVDFLAGDDPLTIAFTLDEADDVTVTLKIDTDEDHNSGNEIAILAQRLIEAGATEDSFDWDGDDSSGAAVDDGIYRIVLVLNRGSGSPAMVESDGLVYRRSEEEQPLIGVLEPARDQTVQPGAYVLIRWRDSDPGESAEIRITIDDDPVPDEGAETGDPESEELADWPAEGGGARNSFQYQVPNDLDPGIYYIFAYIDRDGAAPYDNVSVAGGRIIIRDPLDGP